MSRTRTIIARVRLNMLRSRNTRREDLFGTHLPDPIVTPDRGLQPEEEALLADTVGLALLVVLGAMSPAERLVFVLHDMFELPFDEIAPMIVDPLRQRDSSPAGQGDGSRAPKYRLPTYLARQRKVVDVWPRAELAPGFNIGGGPRSSSVDENRRLA